MLSWTKRWNIRNRLLECGHLHSKKFAKIKRRAGHSVLDTWRRLSNRWCEVLLWFGTSYHLWKYRCSSSISIRIGWISNSIHVPGTYGNIPIEIRLLLYYIERSFKQGIYGFYHYKDEKTGTTEGGNYALSDLALGLKFITANSERLGAKPGQITLNGQSAGSSAVMALLLHDESASLISGALAQSGPSAVNFINGDMNEEVSRKICSRINDLGPFQKNIWRKILRNNIGNVKRSNLRLNSGNASSCCRVETISGKHFTCLFTWWRVFWKHMDTGGTRRRILYRKCSR